MRKRPGALAAIVAASAMSLLALPAFGQQSVSVQFTGSYTTTWGNYGAGIYGANINGSPSASGMICDDFKDEITSGEAWTAKAYQVSSIVSNSTLSSLMFGSAIGESGYAEIASLANMLFSGSSTYTNAHGLKVSGLTQAEIASAIWFITTQPSGISGLDETAAKLVGLVVGDFANNDAGAQAYLRTLTNLWILTPANWTSAGQPQEMFTLGVPEGGASTMYLLLGALCCFGALMYRRHGEC